MSTIPTHIEQIISQMLCVTHSKQSNIICLQQDCIINYKNAFYCNECFKTHQAFHNNDQIEYLSIEDAYLENMKAKIDFITSVNEINIAKIFDVIEETFGDFEKFLLNKVKELKKQLKMKINANSSNVMIKKYLEENKIQNANFIPEIIEQNSSINVSVSKYLLCIKENFEKYSNIVQFVDLNKEFLDNLSSQIPKKIEEFKIKYDFGLILELNNLFKNSAKEDNSVNGDVINISNLFFIIVI